MSDLLSRQMIMSISEVIVIALLLLGLYRLRSLLGLAPLYITLGVFQPIQVLLASSIYVEFFPGIVISPGSAIMFTGSLFAILLVYIRQDAIEARKVIYGILLANLAMTLLLLVFGMQIDMPDTLNFLGLPREVFNQNAQVMLAGTIALLIDVLLIIFVYEAISRTLLKVPFLRIYLTMATILILDTIIFSTGAFWGQPNLGSIIVAGIVGKVSIALIYTLFLVIYLRFVEPVETTNIESPNPYQDIFFALTYRDKFELEKVRVDELIREYEQKIRTVIDQSVDGFAISDEQGTVIFWNQSLEEITGITSDQVLTKPIWDAQFLMTPADQRTPERYQQLKTELLEFLETGKAPWMNILLERKYIQPNGTQLYLQGRTFPIKTEKGFMLGSITRDISEQVQAVEALQESEERFRAIFQQVAVGVAQVVSTTGQIINVNQRYCDIVGYSSEELINQKWQDITHPDDLQADLDNMQLLIDGHIHEFTMEKRYYHKDGSIIWVNIAVSPMWGKGDEPTFHITVVEDITKRKVAEKALRDREELYRILVNTAPYGIQLSDLDGRIIFSNPAHHKIQGYDDGELIDKYIWDLIDDEVESLETKEFYNTLVKEMPAPTIYYSQDRTKDNRVIFTEINWDYILNTSGNLEGIVSIISDITEKIEAEKKLQEKHTRLRQALQAAKAGAWEWNILTNQVFWSEENYEVLGLSPDHDIASFENWLNRVHPEDREMAQEKVFQAERDKSDLDIEFRIIRLDGSVRWINDVGKMVFDDSGQPLAMYGVQLDITERKRTEAELRNFREQLQALANHLQTAIEEERAHISREVHDEFGQRLTALKMDLVSTSQLIPDTNPDLAIRIGRMSALVDDTIDKIRKLSSQLHPGLLDDLGLSAAIEWQANSFQGYSGIQCTLDLPDDQTHLPPALSIAIYRIFQEALTNIARHAQATQVHIKFAMDQNQIQLKIADNGRGITKEEINQNESLGLLSMRERLRPWKGRIDFHGKKGKGTVVKVQIPLGSISQEEPQ